MVIGLFISGHAVVACTHTQTHPYKTISNVFLYLWKWNLEERNSDFFGYHCTSDGSYYSGHSGHKMLKSKIPLMFFPAHHMLKFFFYGPHFHAPVFLHTVQTLLFHVSLKTPTCSAACKTSSACVVLLGQREVFTLHFSSIVSPQCE